MSVCFILGLLLWTRAGGSSSRPTFIQTNRDLLLTVTEEVPIGRDIFYWRFNHVTDIVQTNGYKTSIYDHYKGRVEFFPHNLSLILKKVQLSDSGIYTVVASRDFDEILSTHDVRVRAPVSPSTPGPAPSDPTPSDPAPSDPAPSDPAPSLQLSPTDVTIASNRSSQVSPTEDTKNCREICEEFTTEESERSWCLVKTVVFSVGLLLMVSSVITVHVLDWTRKKNN